LILLGAILFSSDARAILVAIKYYDQGVVNPEFAGGPLWTGFVDTVANTLTITAWTELPLHGNEFWIPRNLVAPPGVSAQPLVWPARDANGNLYDVSDLFDGHIDNTFAFISDQHLREMLWKAPLFNYNTTPPTFLGTTDVNYTLDTGDVWPGWGGFALQRNVPGVGIVKVFETANPDPNQPVYNERIMPALPVKAPGATDPTYVSSSNAIITATRYATSTSAVPEARQWLAVPAVFLVVLAFRLFSHRRHSVME
jgi:hypothetical protein